MKLSNNNDNNDNKIDNNNNSNSVDNGIANQQTLGILCNVHNNYHKINNQSTNPNINYE
jgi:hypothetical protein